MIGYEWHDLIGNIGVVVILGTYLLLQIEKISPDNLYFSVFNALGAAMVIYSLFHEFNLSAFVIEACWLLISLHGILRRITAAGRV